MRMKQTQYGQITKFSQLEYNILCDFICEARSFETNIRDDDIQGWLELSQHYGAPTRLLDITENPMVALYFACRSMSDSMASVWIINEKSYLKKYWDDGRVVNLTIDSQQVVRDIIYREIVLLGKQKPLDCPEHHYPWIYKPLYRDERMKLQSSMFMIWGSKPVALNDIIEKSDYMNLDSSEEVEKGKGILFAITIPSEKKKDILEQLDMLGINEKYIYPGLEGVGKTIAKKYSSR